MGRNPLFAGRKRTNFWYSKGKACFDAVQNITRFYSVVPFEQEFKQRDVYAGLDFEFFLKNARGETPWVVFPINRRFPSLDRTWLSFLE